MEDFLNSESFLLLNYDERASKIGSLLKNKRMELGLTVANIIEKTKLKGKYIEMIENGLFYDASRKIYVYGYVQVLCNIFNIDAVKVINFLDQENLDSNNKIDSKKDNDTDNYLLTKIKQQQSIASYNDVLFKKIIKIISPLSIILLIIFFIKIKK